MTRRNVLIACVALVAIIGAYALGRWNPAGPAAALPADAMHTGAAANQATQAAATSPSSADKPASVAAKNGALPLPGLPLKDTFAELQAAANAGDAGAATRLVRDLDRCSRLRGSQWKSANATGELTGKNTDGMTPAQLRTYEVMLNATELSRQGVRESQQLCAGASDAMLDSLVANIARAAQLGDVDARACYLGRGPLYDARSLLDHPESLRAYRSTASALMDAGLAAGDWRVVDLLQQAYEPGAQGLLAGVVGADPAQHYRYLKLYRLGAEQHRAAALDRQLASAAASLPATQVADADAWAQTTVRGNFSGNSTSATPQGWDACAF